jgi:hypothetical protein
MPIDRTPIAATDYIELNNIVAFSPIGPYQVRIFAKGRVERKMPGCSNEAIMNSMSPEVAQKLLNRAREGGFLQLCAVYKLVPQPGLNVDGDETSLTLSLHGKAKTVLNSLGNPPVIYHELTDAIKEISQIGKFKAACDAARRPID